MLDRTAQVISRASWKNETLVLEETELVDGRPSRWKLQLSFESANRLVLVRDRPLIAYADTPAHSPEAARRLVFARRRR